MKNARIHDLLKQISALEEQLRTAVHEQESRIFFQIKGRPVEFEQSVQQAHRKLRTGLVSWLTSNRPWNLLTFPIIYSMIVPLVLVDCCVSFYQLTCFPVYGIRKVKRNDYMVHDRHQLGYLNFFQRFHCAYCAYASGLIAYIGEIVARTEQYFCPIKHARKLLGTHARYNHFLDFGDADEYETRLEEFRANLSKADEELQPQSPARDGQKNPPA